MSLKKQIQVAGLQILEVNISPQDSQWSQISLFSQTFGPVLVLAAFETWAQENKGRTIPYPLSEFVRVAPRMITRVTREDTTPFDQAALDDLCSDLYLVGGPAFSGKHRDVLGTLLQEYNADEIKSAYTEFIASFDDFDLKTAPRKFSEGGGKAVLLATKKRRDQLKQQQELIEQTKRIMLEQHAARSSATTGEADTELPEAN